ASRGTVASSLDDLEADALRLAVVAGRVCGGERELVGAGLELAALQAAVERDARRPGSDAAREAPERHRARAVLGVVELLGRLDAALALAAAGALLRDGEPHRRRLREGELDRGALRRRLALEDAERPVRERDTAHDR